MNQDRLRAHLAEKQLELEMKKMEYKYKFKLAAHTASQGQPRLTAPSPQVPHFQAIPPKLRVIVTTCLGG